MLVLKSWESPISHLPDMKVGEAELVTVSSTPGIYRRYCLGPNGYEGSDAIYYRAKKTLKIRSLRIEGKEWMVDDPPHWWAMIEHAKHYSGHVIVAGLGMGLILYTMRANFNITKITVVEKCHDVIKMMFPPLQEQAHGFVPISLIHGDFWEYAKLGGNYDGVFYDLLVGNGDDLQGQAIGDMLKIKRLFSTAKTFRIHGMSNEYLNELTDGIRHVETSYHQFFHQCGNKAGQELLKMINVQFSGTVLNIPPGPNA